MKIADHNGPAGLFFLRIVRMMAVGGVNDARAASLLLSQFGANYRRPLVLIRAMMLELSRASRRKILLAPPCCGRITADEALMLSALERSDAEFALCHADALKLLDRDIAIGPATCFQAVSHCFADLGAPISRLSPRGSA
jgi:hypothetical protein